MSRKNPYQRLMTRWDEVLPYNAVHVITVSRSLDKRELCGAIQKALARCGWTLDPGEIPLRECEGVDLSGERCSEEMRKEINQRFEHGAAAVPFRFFCASAGESRFVVGVCYHHVVAGGDSICWLLEDIVSKYIGEGEDGAFPWSGKRAPAYRTLMRRSWRTLWRWVRCFPEDIRRSRRFLRPSKPVQPDAPMGVQAARLSEAQSEWVRERAAEAGATINDVFITVILLAAAGSRSIREDPNSDGDISIGSIVNTRNLFGPEHARTFGLFIGFVSVAHPVPEGTSFDELIAAVREQTRRIEMDGFHLWNVIKVSAGLLWSTALSSKKRLQFFRENLPLSVGVTSFSVDRFQNRLAEMPVTDYWRSVSACPSTPLVLTSTYFMGGANVTFNYDQSVHSDKDVSAFVERFLKQLDGSC